MAPCRISHAPEETILAASAFPHIDARWSDYHRSMIYRRAGINNAKRFIFIDITRRKRLTECSF